MTYTSLIKLWRILTSNVLYHLDDLPPGIEVYQRGSMRLGSAVQQPGDPVPSDAIRCEGARVAPAAPTLTVLLRDSLRRAAKCKSP